MKVLIATPYLPYPGVPHGGGQDLYHLIRYLGERHTVRVASFADAAQAAHAGELCPYVDALTVIRPAVTLSQKAASALAALRRGQWRSLGHRADSAMRAAVSTPWADVLYCAWTEMGRYLAAAAPGVVRVLDEVDVRFLVEEAAGRQDAAERRALELDYCRTADLVVTRSIRDWRLLQAHLPGLRGLVLPPVAHVADYLSIRAGESQPGRVLLVGAMDRRRNQAAARWLVEAIWPLVRAACPQAALHIVGANPPPDIRALAGAPSVAVTGWVDDLRAEYAAAQVIVAPLRSEAGALNKVIDGLAAGRPVVATTAANAGIGAPPQAIALADDAQSFAAAITRLLRDGDAWQRLAAAGRSYAREAFDWPGAAARLEGTLLERVAAKYKAGRG